MCTAGLLAADEVHDRAVHRGADTTTRRRRSGHPLPGVRSRVIALERREVLRKGEPTAPDGADLAGERDGGEVVTRRRDRGDAAPLARDHVVLVGRGDEAASVRAADDEDADARRDCGRRGPRTRHRRDLLPASGGRVEAKRAGTRAPVREIATEDEHSLRGRALQTLRRRRHRMVHADGEVWRALPAIGRGVVPLDPLGTAETTDDEDPALLLGHDGESCTAVIKAYEAVTGVDARIAPKDQQ